MSIPRFPERRDPARVEPPRVPPPSEEEFWERFGGIPVEDTRFGAPPVERGVPGRMRPAAEAEPGGLPGSVNNRAGRQWPPEPEWSREEQEGWDAYYLPGHDEVWYRNPNYVPPKGPNLVDPNAPPPQPGGGGGFPYHEYPMFHRYSPAVQQILMRQWQNGTLQPRQTSQMGPPVGMDGRNTWWPDSWPDSEPNPNVILPGDQEEAAPAPEGGTGSSGTGSAAFDYQRFLEWLRAQQGVPFVYPYDEIPDIPGVGY